jgi:dephospho-CoA kinase
MPLKSKIETKILKIGITGGIGSGKTLVSRIFFLLGVPVYNADERAKWILASDKEVKEKVIEVFGTKAYQDNKLNREYISQQIFNDQSKLDLLNSIVHPRVGSDFEKWLPAQSEYPYILKEAALLYEAGTYKSLDKIITVFSPPKLRMKRLLERDPHRTEEDIRRIMEKQMDESEKVKRADYVIYNDEKNMLIPQVLALDETFKRLK